MELYYAVSGTGQGVVYKGRPFRDDHRKCWLGEMIGCVNTVVCLFEAEGFELPAIRWNDEPVKLELSLKL